MKNLSLLFAFLLLLFPVHAMGEMENSSEYIQFEEKTEDGLDSWLMEPYFLSRLPVLFEESGLPAGRNLSSIARLRMMEKSTDDEIDALFSAYMNRIAGGSGVRIRLNEYLLFYSFSYSTVRAKDMIGKHGMDAMELAFPDGWPKGIGCYDAFRMASGNLADNEEEEVAN